MDFSNQGRPGAITNAPKIQSLLDDGANLNERLAKLLHNVEQLGDKLLGSTPRDASAKEPPEPSPSVRRHADQARALLSMIEDEVQRIDARL